MDTSKNCCLNIIINDNSYINKFKNSLNLIKNINSDMTLIFIKKNDENIIEMYGKSSQNDINIYIKHKLNLDDNNFKCNYDDNQILISVKSDILYNIFKVINVDSLLRIYMYKLNQLFILSQEPNKISVSNNIQIMEMKEKPKKYSFPDNRIVAQVIMDTELLNTLFKKRIQKDASSILIRLTDKELTFIMNDNMPMACNLLGSRTISNLTEINYPSDLINIEIKKKNNNERFIIESNYVYSEFNNLKNIKLEFYSQVIIFFIQSPVEGSYVLQFIFTGAGDRLEDDFIKITLSPCQLDNDNQYDNINQLNYNN